MSPLLLPTWEDLASTHPLVATMRELFQAD